MFYWLLWFAVVLASALPLAFHLDQYVLLPRESWWVAPLLLALTAPRDACARLDTWLLSSITFAFVTYSINVDLFEATVQAFQVPFEGILGTLRFVMQGVAAGMLLSLVMAVPLCRVFGTQAPHAAILITVVALLPDYAAGIFDLERWQFRRLATLLYVFQIVICALLVTYACERRVGAVQSPMSRSDRTSRAWLIGSTLLPRNWGAVAVWLLVGLVVIRIASGLTDKESSVPVVAALVWVLALADRSEAWRATRVSSMRGALPATGTPGQRVGLVLVPLCLAVYWFIAVTIVVPRGVERAVAVARAQFPPVWQVDWSEEAQTIYVDGEFDEGLSVAFARAMHRHPEARVVELSSPGGQITEAIVMAADIREAGLATLVRGDCASACSMAFVGGTPRTIAGHGRIGFHRPTVGGVPDVGGEQYYVDHFVRFGIDEAFARRAMSVSHSGMWFPATRELLQAGVVTSAEVVNSERLALRQ